MVRGPSVARGALSEVNASGSSHAWTVRTKVQGKKLPQGESWGEEQHNLGPPRRGQVGGDRAGL